MSYQSRLDEQNDIVREVGSTISSGIWSEGATSLTSFFTSSVQSGSNGAYYMQVFNKDCRISATTFCSEPKED